jgi:hypothetical protein
MFFTTISRLKRYLNFLVRLLLFTSTKLAYTKHLGLRALQVLCFLVLARNFHNFFGFYFIYILQSLHPQHKAFSAFGTDLSVQDVSIGFYLTCL